MFKQALSVSLSENVLMNSDEATFARTIQTMTDALKAKTSITQFTAAAASNTNKVANSTQNTETKAVSNCCEITFENERNEIEDELNIVHENYQRIESDDHNVDGFDERERD